MLISFKLRGPIVIFLAPSSLPLVLVNHFVDLNLLSFETIVLHLIHQILDFQEERPVAVE